MEEILPLPIKIEEEGEVSDSEQNYPNKNKYCEFGANCKDLLTAKCYRTHKKNDIPCKFIQIMGRCINERCLFNHHIPSNDIPNNDILDNTRSPSRKSYRSRSPNRKSYRSRSPNRKSYRSRSPNRKSYRSRSPNRKSHRSRSLSKKNSMKKSILYEINHLSESQIKNLLNTKINILSDEKNDFYAYDGKIYKHLKEFL
jgi:hypothetical protein